MLQSLWWDRVRRRPQPRVPSPNTTGATLLPSTISTPISATSPSKMTTTTAGGGSGGKVVVASHGGGNGASASGDLRSILEDVRIFTLPLLAVWLCPPLLSLIDTAVVGLSAGGGILHLAALGPAVTVCDNSLYVLMSLAIVTTNLVATAEVRRDNEAAARAVEDGLTASAVLGALWGAVLASSLGVNVLAVVAGQTVEAGSTTLPISVSYTRIRTICFVPTLMCWVCQAACIARRDVRTPLRGVFIATVLNIIADVLLVLQLEFGAVGAAVATVIAQSTACAFLLKNELEHARVQRALRLTQTNNPSSSPIALLSSSSHGGGGGSASSAGSTSSAASSSLSRAAGGETNGNNNNSNDNGSNGGGGGGGADQKPHRSHREHAAATIRFMRLCVSPACALLGKAAALIFLTLTASGCGRAALAAHQVIYCIYCLFCPMGEALSQTMQSLLPAALADPSGANAEGVPGGAPSRRLNRRAWSLVKCVGVMGIVLGGLDAALAGSLPVALPWLFTKSEAVATQMELAAPTLAMCLLLHALSNMLEGILFATKDSSFFSRMYPASSVAVIFLFAQQRSAGEKPVLQEVWRTFFIYQCLRFVQCLLRVAQNQHSGGSGGGAFDEHLSSDEEVPGEFGAGEAVTPKTNGHELQQKSSSEGQRARARSSDHGST